jgi:hypothetical protein
LALIGLMGLEAVFRKIERNEMPIIPVNWRDLVTQTTVLFEVYRPEDISMVHDVESHKSIISVTFTWK